MYGVLDYLDENALKRYPFKDGVSLLNKFGGFRIPFGYFGDFTISLFNKGVTRVYLSKLENDLTNFTFHISDVDTTLLIAEVIVPVASVVNGEFIPFSNAACALKIVPGKGLEEQQAVAFSYLFNPDATEFSPKTTNPYFPIVNRISVDGGVTWATADDLSFDAGTNLNMAFIGGKVFLDVVPGGGKGLYNPCGKNPDAIKTINGVASDNGSYHINTTECYSKFRLIGGMFIINKCNPPCLAEQYVDVGHYMNRVNDMLIQADTLVRHANATVNARNAGS